MKSKYLFVIPARGGSKGLPGKNHKLLCGKPLVLYSLSYARIFANDQDICISTDDILIEEVTGSVGYSLPFYRPNYLSDDHAGMREVLIHALHYYEAKGKSYEGVVLLQPTSPFRVTSFFEEAVALFEGKKADMVVSVCESKENPYFNLFEESAKGFLKLSKPLEGIKRRQDAPKVYRYNGSLYIIKRDSLEKYPSMADFPSIIKYVIPDVYGVDIDNAIDWNQAEYLFNNNFVKSDG